MKSVAIILVVFVFVGLNAASLLEYSPDRAIDFQRTSSWIAWMNPDAQLEHLESGFAGLDANGDSVQCPPNAENLFLQATEFARRYPTNVQGWIVYARGAICLDNKSEGIRALSNIELLMPSSSRVRRQAGELWSLLGEENSALRAFKASVTARPRDIDLLREQVVALAPTAAVAATVLLPEPMPSSISANYLPESNMRFALSTGNRDLADSIWDRSLVYTDRLSYSLNKYVRYIEEEAELERVRVVAQQLDFPPDQIGVLQNGGFDMHQPSAVFGWRSLKSRSHSIHYVSEIDGDSRSAIRIDFKGVQGTAFNHLSQIILLNEVGEYELSGQWTGNLKGRLGGAFVDVKQLTSRSTVGIEKRTGDWKWTKFSISFVINQVPERIVIRVRGSGADSADNALKGSIWLDDFVLTKV